MVMSVGEQIASLEQELEQTSGKGSKKKKEEIQASIDELKKQNDDTDEEKEKKSAPPPPVKVRQGLPPYLKTTPEKVKAAEKAGTLCGFDAEKMTASIRE